MAAIMAATNASAQESKPTPWFSNIKLSGYGLVEYQYSGQKDKEANTFDLRLVRVSLDGRIAGDFYWKAQMQINGNTATKGSSPRLVDLFAEWQKYGFFKVKAGQFKLPFTFENPMHPIDQGFMSYSQNVSCLSGFSDRSGQHSSNGRDIGVQLQGDFLKNKSGRNLIHYQVGVFNGQGTNHKDVDQRKDVIGGIWVSPVKGLRIGAFGWTGSSARKGTWDVTDANHNVVKNEDGSVKTQKGVRSLSKNRYAFSAEYAANDWTVRSEYIHSQSYGFTKSLTSGKETDCNVNYAAGDQADGFYALMIAPVISKKLYAKARYDLYRPRAEWGTSRTQYEIGANYWIGKSIMIGAEYARINDRSLAKPDYNMIDVEFDVKF